MYSGIYKHALRLRHTSVIGYTLPRATFETKAVEFYTLNTTFELCRTLWNKITNGLLACNGKLFTSWRHRRQVHAFSPEMFSIPLRCQSSFRQFPKLDVLLTESSKHIVTCWIETLFTFARRTVNNADVECHSVFDLRLGDMPEFPVTWRTESSTSSTPESAGEPTAIDADAEKGPWADPGGELAAAARSKLKAIICASRISRTLTFVAWTTGARDVLTPSQFIACSVATALQFCGATATPHVAGHTSA